MTRDTFTPDERDIFIMLTEEHKEVLSNNSGSVQINNAKKEAWKVLTVAFDREPRSSGVPRLEGQLREYLKRLKIQARKLISQFKKQQSETGGGEAPPALPSWVNNIERIFPTLTKEFHCRFDSDFPSESLESPPSKYKNPHIYM